MPTVEDCLAHQKQIGDFVNSIDWETGWSPDHEKVIIPPSDERQAGRECWKRARHYDLVLVVHRTPRFVSCGAQELSETWRGLKPLNRVTTLAYRDGSIESIEESADWNGLAVWEKPRAWVGRTVLAFPRQPRNSPPAPVYKGKISAQCCGSSYEGPGLYLSPRLAYVTPKRSAAP